ncbi:hypothetical protein CISIN_1g048590mg [Citrus sinensis]|uniref:Uncharacterized protein n=1 Tax=Citrus sinensis TaxID=2711 RepID=A0A067EZI3_CITSI|nr:hypothetical protein CISIN_1g048590mg [Citrus sinensis]
MAVSLTRFSWWLWNSNKEKEPVSSGSINSSSSNERAFGDTVTFPSTRIASTPRKVKKKWQSREERKKMDKEWWSLFSGSESDDSDWSIGWLEPHGADFQTDDESDNSFAVLVPCYRPGCKELEEASNIHLLNAIKNLPHELLPGYASFLYVFLIGIKFIIVLIALCTLLANAEGNNLMELWLSSLQNI